MRSKTLRTACGIILASLVFVSACLAVAGIWGMVDGDTAGQLFGTFITVGGASAGMTYIADKFFQ